MTEVQDDINSQIQELKEIIGTPEDSVMESKHRVQRVCFSSIWILVAITPVVVFLLLFFIEPGFIQKKQGNEWVIDNQKLWSYWALFTFCIWVLLALYSFSRGYRSNVDMCY